jgi:hypothetical protein
MKGVSSAFHACFWLCLLAVSPSASQEKQYYFYKPAQTRGSDAAFSPMTLLLNGSFDALRIGTQTAHDLSLYNWRNDAQNIWHNVTHPIESVRAYGWETFRRQELFNLSLDVNDLQFIPNLADHTIGYGMQYAKVTEWYDAHGYPTPVLWGIGTSLVYQYVNEMMQNGGRIYVNVDCVADYDIFNVLGYALFSFDGVKQFFSESVQLNDWSLQPLYVPRNHRLENVGQEFLLRYKLPFAERYAPFISWGVNSVVGLSYRYDDSNSISLGIGQAVTGMIENHRGEYLSDTPKLEGAVGLYWDNDGSLLTGLTLWGKTSYNVQLNIYPGLLDFHGIQPGCYIGAGEREGLVFGVTFMNVPISLGFQR